MLQPQSTMPQWFSRSLSQGACVFILGNLLINNLDHMFTSVYVAAQDSLDHYSHYQFWACLIGACLALLLASRGKDGGRNAGSAAIAMSACITLHLVWKQPDIWANDAFSQFWLVASADSMEATLVVVLLAFLPWLAADTVQRSLKVSQPELQSVLSASIWIGAAIVAIWLEYKMQHELSYAMKASRGETWIVPAVFSAIAVPVVLLDLAHERATTRRRRILTAAIPNLLLAVGLVTVIGFERATEEGPFEITGSEGTLLEEGTYKSGRLHGRHLEYLKNGKLKRETWYWEGKEHGLYQSWDDEGGLLERGAYDMGYEVGMWERWNRGELQERTVHLQRYAPDPTTAFSSGGKMRTEVRYEPDLVHGTEIQWRENGQKFSEQPLLFGYKHGIGRRWNEDGTLHVEYPYVLDGWHGEERRYAEKTGELSSSKSHSLPEWKAQLADALDPGWRDR